jgi:uncharacterized membrane protein YphA (DoxX/SURF4 family)
MTVLTRFSLVLLRLAIGWHFLFEGLDKLESYFRGPADGKTVWTSEHYLRESTGPLRTFFRAQAGDLNEAALERLTIPPGQPPKLPPALENDWKDHYERFVAFYAVGTEKPAKTAPPQFLHLLAVSTQSPFPTNLPWAPLPLLPELAKRGPQELATVPPEFLHLLAVVPQGQFPASLPWAAVDELAELAKRKPEPAAEKLQLALAELALSYAKAESLRWLISGEREATRSFSQITEKVKEKTPERIKKYREKLAQFADIEKYGLPGMGKDVWKKKLATLKDEINKLRTELLADLNQPMNKAMEFTFQKRIIEPQRERLPIEYRGKALLPAVARKGMLFWIDQLTMWGVTAVGVCLLLGLFTRTACLGGAGFLLMFYLAMPALPWLPVNPRAEGHYFFVNKNIIEMLALLTLATTQSGRWAGLDGLIHALSPWRRAEKPAPRPAADEPVTLFAREAAPSASVARSPDRGPTAEEAQAPPSPVTSSPVKESPHGP